MAKKKKSVNPPRYRFTVDLWNWRREGDDFQVRIQLDEDKLDWLIEKAMQNGQNYTAWELDSGVTMVVTKLNAVTEAVESEPEPQQTIETQPAEPAQTLSPIEAAKQRALERAKAK